MYLYSQHNTHVTQVLVAIVVSNDLDVIHTSRFRALINNNFGLQCLKINITRRKVNIAMDIMQFYTKNIMDY